MHPIFFFRTGDFFGEGCLIGQPVRLAGATAITECAIMRIKKPAMIRVLHEFDTQVSSVERNECILLGLERQRYFGRNMSYLSSGVIFAARAFLPLTPPLWPSASASGSLPCFVARSLTRLLPAMPTMVLAS